MRRLLLTVLLLLAPVVLWLLPVPDARAGDDVLKTYKKRFDDKALLSEREHVLDELAECKDARALEALLWCRDVAREGVDGKQDEAEKLRKKIDPVYEEYQEKYRKYAEQQAKQGNPNPKTHPAWPVRLELDKLTADLEFVERQIAEWRGLVKLATEYHGRIVAALPAGAQQDLRAAWEKGALADRDWAVRAEQWSLVGGVPTDWALEMLEKALSAEPDPRVLVHVIDGLGGRDAARVVPLLAGQLADVRWLVRAAAVAALERTPSKESIDALVDLFQKEDGRLQDDCARALAALTGEDLGTNAVAWRNWWEKTREGWAGRPEPVAKKDGEKDDKPEPIDVQTGDEPAPGSGRTGFFGIDTRSKRLVYVIDVSGSMNEAAGRDEKRTRAELAKEELKRAILGLEDGALFNIVFFSADVRIWKKEMVVADATTRPEAVEYVDQVAVVGGTATYDALQAAFDLGDVGRGKKRGADPEGDSKVDTIILLSDGRPSVGHTTNTDEIRAAVKEWNAARRIAVHTVAFGHDADRDFMAGLAEDTGGTSVAK